MKSMHLRRSMRFYIAISIIAMAISSPGKARCDKAVPQDGPTLEDAAGALSIASNIVTMVPLVEGLSLGEPNKVAGIIGTVMGLGSISMGFAGRTSYSNAVVVFGGATLALAVSNLTWKAPADLEPDAKFSFKRDTSVIPVVLGARKENLKLGFSMWFVF